MSFVREKGEHEEGERTRACRQAREGGRRQEERGESVEKGGRKNRSIRIVWS
jgi:hypothetical protein